MPIDKQLDTVEHGLKRFESPLERLIFGARWLMAPFYLGLIGSLAVLMFKFIQELIHFFPLVASADESQVILWVLALIDLSLAGNLVLMVIFSGSIGTKVRWMNLGFFPRVGSHHVCVNLISIHTIGIINHFHGESTRWS